MHRHGQSSSAKGTYQRNDTNCCPAGDDGYPPKGEVAGLKNVWVAVDPEQTIMIGPVNGRYARESGLRLKA